MIEKYEIDTNKENQLPSSPLIEPFCQIISPQGQKVLNSKLEYEKLSAAYFAEELLTEDSTTEGKTTFGEFQAAKQTYYQYLRLYIQSYLHLYEALSTIREITLTKKEIIREAYKIILCFSENDGQNSSLHDYLLSRIDHIHKNGLIPWGTPPYTLDNLTLDDDDIDTELACLSFEYITFDDQESDDDSPSPIQSNANQAQGQLLRRESVTSNLSDLAQVAPLQPERISETSTPKHADNSATLFFINAPNASSLKKRKAPFCSHDQDEGHPVNKRKPQNS